MEKQHDMTLVKARSYRKVLTTGFQLYLGKFRQFFKKSWLTALLLAMLYGALGALALLMYPATPLALLLLICMPLVLPVIYALIRRLLKGQREFWVAPRNSLKVRLRHGGLLLTVLLSSIFLVMLISCIIQIPAIILCLANLQALQGIQMGDPSGMPSYMIGLTLFTFVLTAYIQFYVSQILLVHYYYACGAIEAREIDRQQQKQLIQ
jgi:hypothetical protein